MVYDNINANTGEINKSWVFTYNEGTFIGAAVELHQIMGEKSYLNDAVLAADYTISSLVNNSILKDEGNGDGGLFKGIFIRYFTNLIQQDRLDTGTKRRYIQFLEKMQKLYGWKVQQNHRCFLVLIGVNHLLVQQD